MADETKTATKPSTKPAAKPSAEEPAPKTKAAPKDEAAEEKECAITKKQFKTGAPAAVKIEGVAMKKEFATGTLGYFGQISVTIEVDGVPVKMNGQVQVFVPNSKNAK
jgi:hypothetical protein